MAIMKRMNVCLDPEARGILEAYRRIGYTNSYVVRKALVNFFRFNKPKPINQEDQPTPSEEVITYD